MSTAWGTVPMSIALLVDLLEARISGHSATLSSTRWPDLPGDITPALTKTLSETESVFAAAKDLRSLLTAYAHKVHQPRPTVAEIARAQRTSSQAIATRYTPELLAAIEVALQIDATVFDRDATREQLESAIRAGASAMDSALQSDIEDDYVLQVSRRLEREIERRPSSTPTSSSSRAHVSARDL